MIRSKIKKFKNKMLPYSINGGLELSSNLLFLFFSFQDKRRDDKFTTIDDEAEPVS